MIKKHLFWIIPFVFLAGIGWQYLNDIPQINTINQNAEDYHREIMTVTNETIMIMDLVGTNETKEEFVDHYCKQDNGFPNYGFGWCEDMIKNGAGYLGFNQTGGFMSH